MSFATVIATRDRIVAASDSRTWNIATDQLGADSARKVDFDGGYVFVMTGAPECFEAWRTTPAITGESAADRAHRILATLHTHLRPEPVDRPFTFAVLRFATTADAFLAKCTIPAGETRVTVLQHASSPQITLPFVSSLGGDDCRQMIDRLNHDNYAALQQQPGESEMIALAEHTIAMVAANTRKVGGPLHVLIADAAGARWVTPESAAMVHRATHRWTGTDLELVSANLSVNSGGVSIAVSTAESSSRAYRFLDAAGSSNYGLFANTATSPITLRQVWLRSTSTNAQNTVEASSGGSVGYARLALTSIDSNTQHEASVEAYNGAASNSILVTPTVVTIAGSGTTLVGVNATPTYTLDVLASAGSHASRIRNSHASAPHGIRIDYTAAAPNGTGSEFLYCQDSGPTQRFAIRSNGGVAGYFTNNVDLCDASVKDIIGPAPSPREQFRRLGFVLGRYTDSTRETPDVMLTAQDVETVFPDLVELFDVDKGLKGIRTHGLIMRALQVIQELDADVTALRREVETLKGR